MKWLSNADLSSELWTCPRNRNTFWICMVPNPERFLCIKLLACQKTCRKSALYSSLSSRMGSPWRTGKIHGYLLRTYGQAYLGSDSGSKATGHARRYPGNLGRWIWSDPHVSRQRRSRERSSHQGFLHVDGRRRCEGGDRIWRDRWTRISCCQRQGTCSRHARNHAPFTRH